jgi:hypothetical protein
MVTSTSLKAYREIEADGLLGRCESLVLNIIKSESDLCEREIEQKLKENNTPLPINNIVARVNQLRKYNLISKSGIKLSPFSGKEVETYSYNEIEIETLRSNIKRFRGIKGRQRSLNSFFKNINSFVGAEA